MIMQIKRSIRVKFILFLAFIFVSGCSQPLRTLMSVGSEQKAQGAYVKRQDRCFDLLMRDIKRERLKIGVSDQYVISRYGEPVLKKGSTFVYRKAVEFLDTPKVYLDFDEKGLLTNIRVQDQNRIKN